MELKSERMIRANPLPKIDVSEDSLLSRHFNLPALPEVIGKIRIAIEEEASVQTVARIVSRDGSLVSHLLKVVNSAYYSLPRQVGDVSFAIAYLGLGEIYRIVLTLGVVRALQPTDMAELKRLWRHAYLTALTSKELCRHFLHIDNVEELYSAALLHDVGKLVYLRFFPDHYEALRETSTRRRVSFVEAEEELELPRHGRLGEILCREWRLPDSIRQVCANHDLPFLESAERESKGRFCTVIAVANCLTKIGSTELTRERQKQILAQVRRLMGFSEGELSTLVDRVVELRREATRFLSDLLS